MRDVRGVLAALRDGPCFEEKRDCGPHVALQRGEFRQSAESRCDPAIAADRAKEVSACFARALRSLCVLAPRPRAQHRRDIETARRSERRSPLVREDCESTGVVARRLVEAPHLQCADGALPQCVGQPGDRRPRPRTNERRARPSRIFAAPARATRERSRGARRRSGARLRRSAARTARCGRRPRAPVRRWTKSAGANRLSSRRARGRPKHRAPTPSRGGSCWCRARPTRPSDRP